MNSRDIFNAAKENNIKELFRVIKEPHQTYSAECVSGMMYINDMKIIDKIFENAIEKDRIQCQRKADGIFPAESNFNICT